MTTEVPTLSVGEGGKLWRAGWYILFALLPFGHTAVGLLVILAGMVAMRIRRAATLPHPAGRATLATAVDRAYAAFFGWAVLSGVLSPKPSVALPLTAGYILMIWGVAFGARKVALNPPLLNRLLRVVTVSGGLAATTILVRYFLLRLPRASLFVTGPNGTGTLLILATGLGMGYLLSRKSPALLVGLFVTVMTGALLATQSRGAWLGFLSMLAVSAAMNRRAIAAIMVIALLFGAVLFAVPGLGARFLSGFDIHGNSSRILVFKSSLLMIRDYPIKGVGAGVYQHVFNRYQLPGWVEGPAAYAHNIFLQVAAEFGLIGLALFAALLGLILLMSWRLARLGHPLYAWMFAALIGVLVHQQVDVPIWGVDVGGAFWLVIGLIVGLFYHEWDAGRLSGALPFGIGSAPSSVVPVKSL